jgi:hypothetical protein
MEREGGKEGRREGETVREGQTEREMVKKGCERGENRMRG